MSLSKDYVMSKLRYSPATGLFYWLASGMPAGCVNTDGYVVIRIDNVLYYAHRLVFLMETGCMPDHVDHEDHNTTNNKRGNLRATDSSGNSKNRVMQSNNSSGVTGVHWHTARSKYRASIYVDKKLKSLGSFVDFNSALAARKAAEILYGYHTNHGVHNVAR